MDKSQKAIEIWKMKGYKRIFWKLGISKGESKTMRKVMRETKGEGGPWFKEYSEKNNLL